MKKNRSALHFLFFLLVLLVSSDTKALNNEKGKMAVTFKGQPLPIEEALSLYVQKKSLSGFEMEAGVWVKELCRENGLYIEDMGNENGNFNFSASLYPLSSKLPNIVFLNHIDIVPAKQISEWEHGPFSGEIENGILYGRGSYDNKGSAIMQLYSLLELKYKNAGNQLPINITFLAVSSEETQGPGGITYVVDNYLEDLNPEVVIGEGSPGMTDVIETPFKGPVFCISVAHKKAFWLELELETSTLGHGSVSPNAYANKQMNAALHNVLKKKPKFVYNDLNVELLKQLGTLFSGSKKLALGHPKLFKPFLVSKIRQQPEMFALFSNTITLTSIESSTHTINSIPSKVTALLDCRLLPEQSSVSFFLDLRNKLGNKNIKMNVLQAMPSSKPSSTSNIYFKSMEASIKNEYPESKVIFTMLPNFTDLGAFRAKGIPSYGVVPVVLEKKYLESIHNVNERIPIEILDRGKNTYVKFIDLLLQDRNLLVME